MARKTTTPAKQPDKAPAAKTGKIAAGIAPTRGTKAPAAKKVATKAVAAAPKPKPTTVTLKHLAAGLSERRGLAKSAAEAFAIDLIGGLLEQVKSGAKVRIAGLGVIEIKDRPAASKKIVFRAAKDLKDAI